MTRLILVANTDWYLYNFRLSLAKELRDKGFDVILISPPGEYVSLLQNLGFAWHEWKVGRQTVQPWQELEAIQSLVRLYRQLKPKLVHHHTIKPVLYGAIAARRAGVPAVVASVTGRGYVFEGNDTRANLLEQFIKPIYRRVMRNRRTQIIFENEGDRQFFIHQGLVEPAQTHLIESVGVDAAYFSPSLEPEGPPVIVLAARMLWDKGVGILAEAAALLQKRGVDFKVVLVGKPDPGNPTSIHDSQLRAWENDGLLEWWGWQSDMRRVYQRCHIAVLPSFHEGVPTGLLEAAASGLPIVASDIPGCRAIVVDGETGFLVSVGQAEPLADALEDLILDPELRGRMGKAGRERILQHFTQQQINQKTLAVYRMALAQPA